MFTSEEESILAELNLALSDSVNLNQYLELREEQPLLFVSGLPRSGTTLCMQILAAGLNINYIDNFTARLWKNPVAGLLLSKIAGLKNGRISFESDFGRTQAINEPHEFSYFWKEHLKYEDFKSYDSRILSDKINWTRLAYTLGSMSKVESRPILFKGLHMAKYFSQWMKYNPNLLVITIEKDPNEISNSLLQARIRRNGNKNNWWSIMPNDFELIKDAPYYEQIPLQLKMLKSDFSTGLEKVPENQKMIINYNDLCENPLQFTQNVHSRMEELFGKSTLRPDFEQRLPLKFNQPSQSNEFQDEELLLATREIFAK